MNMNLIKTLAAFLMLTLLSACGGGGGNPGTSSGGTGKIALYTTAPTALSLTNGTTSAGYFIGGGTAPYMVSPDKPALIGVSMVSETWFTLSAVAGTSGTGSVTIADSAGAKVTVAVTVPSPSALFTTAPSNLTLAIGASSIPYQISGGTAPYAAVSTNPGLLSPTVQGPSLTITALPRTTGGTANVIVSDAAGSQLTITVTVSATVALFVDAPANLTVSTSAPGNTYTVSVSGGLAPYTAVSSNKAVATASTPGADGRFVIQGVSAGSATITIKDTTGGAGIALSVTVPAPLALFSNAPATLQILNGATNFYTIFGGVAPYVVNTNGVVARAVINGSSLAITGLVPGNQTVAISDAKGAVITIDVTVKAGLYTDAPASLSVAANTGVSYSIYGGIPFSGAALYKVNSSNPAVANATVSGSTLAISGISVGTTSLVITDSVGAAVSVAVTVPAAGALMTTAPSALKLATGTSGTYAIWGGSGTYTATSSNPALVSAGAVGSVLTIGAVADTIGGTANVIISDNVGTPPLTIVVTAAPVQFFTTAPSTLAIAAGASKVFALFGGTLPYSVVNTHPDIASGQISSNTVLTITGAVAGTGTIIVSDAKGATVTITVVVNAPGPLYISAPASVVIQTGSSNAYDIIGGIPPYKASSSNLAVAVATIVNANQVNVSAVGSGSATITVTDSAGTQVSISVTTGVVGTFYVSAPAALSMGAGTSAGYLVSGGTKPYTASSSDIRVATVTVDSAGALTINALSAGVATLRIADTPGLSPYTITVTVDNSGGGAFYVSAPPALRMAAGTTSTPPYLVRGGTKPYSASSSDTRVATVTVDSAGALTINALSAGVATLQIADATGVGPYTIPVTVDNTGGNTFYVSAPAALTMGAGTSAAYRVTGGTKPYVADSSDVRIATVTVDSAGVLTINALAVGAATLRIADATGLNPYSITVTVDNSGGTGPSAAASIDILASGNSLNSTPGSSVSFVVTVKDSANTALPGQTVTFTPSSGTLTGANPPPVTNAAGTVSTVSLSPGSDASIRNITVTAKTGTVSKSITIPVVGTTLSVSGPGSVLLGSAPQNFTLKAVDSAGKPVVGASLTIASALLNGISPTTTTTGSAGTGTVAFTAAIVGTDTLTVTGLGTSSTAKVIVSNVDFTFVAPAAGASLNVGVATPVTVLYRVSGVGVAGQTVNFATTRGTLSATSAVTGSGLLLGQATVTVSSTTAGPVTLSAQLSTASTSVNAAFIATVPATVVLQANPAALPPNAGGSTTNQSALTAVVRDAVGNPVQGAVVNFAAITDGSSGSIAPGSVTTDAYGQATAQFIAGPLSTATNGVWIKATMQSNPAINSDAYLTVNGSALFISIARSGTLTAFDSTTYQKDFSVYVTDATGAPAGGRLVTLSVWPTTYGKGKLVYTSPLGPWTYAANVIAPTSSLACLNEDANRNGILDAGEDFNLNGKLDPGSPAVITPSVTTDALGFGSFTLRYGKNYAWWVSTQITAKSLVSGTESMQLQNYALEMLADDATSASTPANSVSPFGFGAARLPLAIICSDPS